MLPHAHLSLKKIHELLQEAGINDPSRDTVLYTYDMHANRTDIVFATSDDRVLPFVLSLLDPPLLPHVELDRGLMFLFASFTTILIRTDS